MTNGIMVWVARGLFRNVKMGYISGIHFQKRGIAMASRLSVCLSVRLSVCINVEVSRSRRLCFIMLQN